MKVFNSKFLTALLICSLGILAYSNTFLCSFHFDDLRAIINNPAIRNIDNLYGIWNFWPTRFLSYFSFALNYHISGLNVFGFHLFNLAVHLISALLVCWLTLLTLATPAIKEEKIASHAGSIALLTGLIFVTHPIQTEAVTYIVQRAASMATMFYLASLCFYIKSQLQPSQHRVLRWFSLIAAVAAMFTKETAITLPLMIVLYEYYFLNPLRDAKLFVSTTWKNIAPFLLILFIIPLTILLTRSEMNQEIHGVLEGPGATSPWHYLLTQFRVILTYIRLAFLPVNQNLDYDYRISKSFFEFSTLTSFLFLIGILFWAKHLFLKYRLLSFSILWFFVTLIPESSLFPSKDLIFEHRLYLPMVGFSIFLVCSVYYLCQHRVLTWGIILIMMISCYSILTYQRNYVWSDAFSLMNDVVGKSPHKPRAYINRGLEYYGQGKINEAIADFSTAIKLDPDSAEAYNDRGALYSLERNLTQAISDYNKAIEIKPDYADAYHNRINAYRKFELNHD